MAAGGQGQVRGYVNTLRNLSISTKLDKTAGRLKDADRMGSSHFNGKAVSAYNAKRDRIVSGELKKLQDATQSMNSALAEWNLPACIEETGDDAVPESILEKSKAVKEQGGLAKLDELMSEMPELATRNKAILDETSHLLDEEEKDDTGLRDNFREKWTRPPSSEFNKPFRKELAKYQDMLDQAGQADVAVKEKYAYCRKAVEILSKSEEELTQIIPKGGASAAHRGSQNVAVLKQLMEHVAMLKAEREVVMKELKDPITDITRKFMEALKNEGMVDEESLLESHLSSAYSKLQEQVAGNVAKQNLIMPRVEEAYRKFSMETRGRASPREQMLKHLAAGHDTFMGLMANIREGAKFYNDFAPLLVSQQSKVPAACLSQSDHPKPDPSAATAVSSPTPTATRPSSAAPCTTAPSTAEGAATAASSPTPMATCPSSATPCTTTLSTAGGAATAASSPTPMVTCPSSAIPCTTTLSTAGGITTQCG